MSRLDNFVFLHGLGLSNTIWKPILPYVKGNFVCPDFLGHGNSPNGIYSFESLWKFLREDLITLDWSSTTLIMHSMSSALLPEILKSKVRPKSIFLIEGNLIEEDSLWSQQICQKSTDEFKSWILKLRANSDLILKMQLKNIHKKNDIATWSSGFKQVKEEALIQIAKQLVSRSKSQEIVSALIEIGSPTIYLRGSESNPWAQGEYMLKNIGVPVIKIPNAGHFPMLDNPYATWESIST
ncbi:alpha/beta hydrolase [Candidatus Thioglobus sp.]|nr:alpha/beta hydrolase [Candidatus Thioglobus sp.]